MKIQPFIEKLESSKEFEDFEHKYKDSFLVAGFFILDYETGQELHQIDYYLPSEKKVAAFTMDEKITLQVLETMNEKVPERLDVRTNIDLESIKGILQDEMKNRSITEDIKKIIAVVQTINGKKIWVLNCVLTGMEILKAHVEDSNKIVLKMERSSIMDYIKKMPALEQVKGQGQGSEKDLAEQIKKLDKLKSELKKQRMAVSKKQEEADE